MLVGAICGLKSQMDVPSSTVHGESLPHDMREEGMKVNAGLERFPNASSTRATSAYAFKRSFAASPSFNSIGGKPPSVREV